MPSRPRASPVARCALVSPDANSDGSRGCRASQRHCEAKSPQRRGASRRAAPGHCPCLDASLPGLRCKLAYCCAAQGRGHVRAAGDWPAGLGQEHVLHGHARVPERHWKVSHLHRRAKRLCNGWRGRGALCCPWPALSRAWCGCHPTSPPRRRPVVINLDPANDELPYPCALDIADLITCSDVMEAMDLGPNGGLMYCMDFLAENAAWLDERIQAIQRESSGGERWGRLSARARGEPASAPPRMLWLRAARPALPRGFCHHRLAAPVQLGSSKPTNRPQAHQRPYSPLPLPLRPCPVPARSQARTCSSTAPVRQSSSRSRRRFSPWSGALSGRSSSG